VIRTDHEFEQWREAAVAGRERMRSFESDTRLALMVLWGDGVEMAGRALVDLLRRSTGKGRVDRAMRALERDGFVSRTGDGRRLDERLYRLTAEGRRIVIGNVDPNRLWSRPWDGRWRIAMFDVPQAKSGLRSRLRRRLREMRFGWLQNSVWLSPDPVDGLLGRLREERVSVENLAILEGRPAGGETDAELVAGAWDFKRISAVHASYLTVARRFPSARRAGADEWVEWARAEQRAWSEVERIDPFLPLSLLPSGYRGTEVWDTRLEALRVYGESLCAMLGPVSSS
jgi:phenylacetic acid degradation operon negative regulatory protein